MATRLLKPVTRVTERPCFTGRQIVITLMPGDYIHLKEKGRHTGHNIPISKVFSLAALGDTEIADPKKPRKIKVKRGLL